MNNIFNPYPKTLWTLKFKYFEGEQKPHVDFLVPDKQWDLVITDKTLLDMMHKIHSVSSLLAEQIIKEMARMKELFGEDQKQAELFEKWMALIRKLTKQLTQQDPPPSQETK